MANEVPGWQKSFVSALTLVGVNAREVDEDGNRNLRFNYQNGTSRVAMALVKEQIAIAFTNDETYELEDDGWAIIRFSTRDLEAFHNVMSGVLNVRRELRKSEMTTPKQTSKAEDMLIDMLVGSEFNLPMPERDYTFRDEKTGREITVPDMAWEKYKVCVYVDGGWWHHGKDVVDQLQMDKKEQREISNRVTKRNEKDANSRRYIEAKLGWRHIACSAERIVESPEYLREVATDIKSIYMDARRIVEAEARFGSADSANSII